MALPKKKQPVITIRITLSPSSLGIEFNQSPVAGEGSNDKALEIAIN